MKKRRKKATKTRGRPRKPENTALVQALIDRQDAFARRRAGEIRRFVAEHVPAAEAEAAMLEVHLIMRRDLEEIPDRVAEQIARAGDQATVRAILADEIRRSLIALADKLDAQARAGTPQPWLSVPPVRRSRTLADARAQAARLQTQLTALKDGARGVEIEG